MPSLFIESSDSTRLGEGRNSELLNSHGIGTSEAPFELNRQSGKEEASSSASASEDKRLSSTSQVSSDSTTSGTGLVSSAASTPTIVSNSNPTAPSEADGPRTHITTSISNPPVRPFIRRPQIFSVTSPVPYERQRNESQFSRNQPNSIFCVNAYRLLYFSIFVLGLVAACIGFIASKFKGSTESKIQICNTTECIVAAGEIIKNLDESVSPCDDFEQFACGGWKNQNPIPVERLEIDNFRILQERIFYRMKKILGSPVVSDEPRAVKQAKIFYKACINDTAWEEAGLLPVLKRMELIGGMPMINSSWTEENFNWLEAVSFLRKFHIMRTLISVDASYDAKNTSRFVITIDNGVLPSSAELIVTQNNLTFSYNFEKLNMGTKILYETLMKQKGNVKVDHKPMSFKFLNNENNTNDSLSQLVYNTSSVNEKLKFLVDQSNHDGHMHLTSLKSTQGTDFDLSVIPEESDFMRFAEKELGSGFVSSGNKSTDGLAGIKSHVLKDILTLWKFITEVAKISYDSVKNRTTEDQYNPMTVKELQVLTDSTGDNATEINWLDFLNSVFSDTGIKLKSTERIIVKNPQYLKDLLVLIKRTPKRDIANFLSYMVFINLEDQVSYSKLVDLPTPGVLNLGRLDERPWADCATTAQNLLPDTISYIYSTKMFNTDSIAPATTMVKGIHREFRELMENTYWMDVHTKREGIDKVDEMLHLVGYDEKSINGTLLDEKYKNVPDFSSKDHVGNMLKIAASLSKSSLTRLNETPSRNVFIMSPSTPNAAYILTKNTMIIPAAILQPPFFRPNTLSALNYGSLGSIIGHEISHGFDNTGRTLDRYGNLRDWWTERSLNQYLYKAACFLKQYERYPIEHNLTPEERLLLTKKDKIDGLATISENIADNVGLRAAHGAFKFSLRFSDKERHLRLPGLEKYSPDQLFFISFAQTWCASYSPKGLKTALTGKKHSPGPYRIKGCYENYYETRSSFYCYNSYRRGSDCTLW